MPLTFLIGGARSGKSSLAVALAGAQDAPVVFIATGEGRDSEMAERIERHRGERPAHWLTIEEPLALGEAIARAGDGCCLVIDCLTLWTANALEEFGVPETELQAASAASAAAARIGRTIAVSNEVGLGIVPADPLSRSYRDLLGRVNAFWAAVAEQALLIVAGRALPLARVEELRDHRG